MNITTNMNYEMRYQFKYHKRHLNFFVFSLIYFYESDKIYRTKCKIEKSTARCDNNLNVIET